VAAPSAQLARQLADVALVTVTGGIGYITAATFDRVLDASRRLEPPWVAAFSLRWVDMAPIGAVLAHHGLELEQLEGRTFRQRRFADGGERAHALGQLRRLGLDPDDAEADGYHHAAFYLARPRGQAGAVPVDELLAPVLQPPAGD
jgi:hypothetical protein